MVQSSTPITLIDQLCKYLLNGITVMINTAYYFLTLSILQLGESAVSLTGRPGMYCIRGANAVGIVYKIPL